ncbi:hypothetical protein [Iodobacter fluviatilis]|uniref:Uncharacterized protein n=1 Tax=Iodobacter fluviatilis TaxID=537 RepID=A0A377Q9S3_9NEIS|nr:hypothetical protein [Iodobacter fluviatilis]TCU82438.1 hypothetical protein EV682_11577 [Iodobacter fluviatilis]STQ91663.1 Uncharacterised protein [Iodobacter fluviatilis]
MDYSSLIQTVQSHISAGLLDGHTEGLIISTGNAIKEQTAPPEQQDQLRELLTKLQKLVPASKPHFPGSTATPL